MQTEKESNRNYCAVCGNELSNHQQPTCSEQCYNILKDFQKKLADIVHEYRIKNSDYGKSSEIKRDLNKKLRQSLHQPVLFPNRSIEQIGKERVFKLLSTYYIHGYGWDAYAIHFQQLDLSTYKKLVGNGWCEFDDKAYWDLKWRAQAK